jgi:hypothetical protein
MKNEELEYKFPSPYFPDWDEMDKNYKYRAFDCDGTLAYYVDKPNKGVGFWKSKNFSFENVGQASWRWAIKIWRYTLEKRPE